MNTVNIVVAIVLAAIIGLAVLKIVRDKKRGVKCSGCPHSCTCSVKDSCD
ncbi:MAG: FeoB-associated Cys-rich membrane protein [Clostridia bacterium]|jgi:hypothetical protein|nr:FeoB-associated Cys-rich membrane protein [Clostridia bacterium]